MKINISKLQDFDGSLEEFKKIIDQLVNEHGKHSGIYFDAGYSNVDVIIVTED